MSTVLQESFRSSLDDLGVACTPTDADGVLDAVAAAVERPAVGGPLGLAGVDLADAGVETTPTPAQLRAAETGVTRAAAGVAELGSLFLRSDAGGTEPVGLFPPAHVAVLRESDLVADLEAGLDWLADEIAAGRGSAVLATGPSTTADMGGLVRGAHGPGRVHVVLVTDR